MKHHEADYVIVGSGASGAVAAAELAERGRDVLVLEEGGHFRTADFGEDLYGAMAAMFRDFGGQTAQGGGVIPVLEGRCVGGSTVINGAIIHRLPRALYQEWCADPAIAARLSFDVLEDSARRIETILDVGSNLASGLENRPAAAVLRHLGWRYEAMTRNAPGCKSTGRCLQGCPSGGKLSMERSLIPRALEHGARLLTRSKALKIETRGGAATGVVFRGAAGREVARARKAVILAAGAVQSPLLLGRSGLGGPATGKNLQLHLGVGVTGEMPRPVREIEGPPQGIEVTQFSELGVKLATQLLPPELRLARTSLLGSELAGLLKKVDHVSNWTCSVRADARGEVSRGVFGRTAIRFVPSARDVERLREGVFRMCQLLFALGAVQVFPGVHGLPAAMRGSQEIESIRAAPLDPTAYSIGAGHIFGTCRMGGDPRDSVVSPEFRLHNLEKLYIIDASVFPTNTGVNPQHSIMTMAMTAIRSVLGDGG